MSETIRCCGCLHELHPPHLGIQYRCKSCGHDVCKNCIKPDAPQSDQPERKVLTSEDVDRIATKFGDPTAVYKCICGMSEHHMHTQACKDANAKRQSEHERHRADIERGDAQSDQPEQERRPWLYAIRDSHGSWQDGESCVYQDLQSCQDDVDMRNEELPEDEPEYFVVPLYRDAPVATPAVQPAQPTEAELYGGEERYDGPRGALMQIKKKSSPGANAEEVARQIITLCSHMITNAEYHRLDARVAALLESFRAETLAPLHELAEAMPHEQNEDPS